LINTYSGNASFPLSYFDLFWYLFNKPGEKPGKSSPSHFGDMLVN